MKLSLRVVVIGGVFAGLLVPMSIGTYYSTTRQEERLLAQADAAHKRVTDVLALGVQKALWDLAPEGAAPLVKSVMDDPRVVQATIVDGQGAVFHEEKDEARRLGTVRTLELPVKNEAQEIGKVRIDFSLASAEEDIRSRMLETFVVSAVQASACLLILVLLLNRRVLARIETLKRQAGLLAAKSLDEPFKWEATDEIGDLGVCLESTRLSLKELFSELERKNADLASINLNLENIVAERTATIKMILDHVKSGFLLIERAQTIESGYTRSCEVLMDAKDSGGLAGSKLTRALGLKDNAAAHFEACVDQVFEDIFPEEVSLEQIPRRAHVGGRTLSIEGSTVRNKQGQVTKILFTVIDVTLLEQTEKENRSNRAMVRILQNIASFRDFVHESKDRLGTAKKAFAAADEATVRRELHTLKGNSSAFGLEDLASLVHSVEDEVRIASAHLQKVESAFAGFLEDRYELLKIKFGHEEPPVFGVALEQLDQLTSDIARAASPAEAATKVKRWKLDIQKVAVETLLGPIANYIETLASQRGKLIRLEVIGGKTRVNPATVKPLVQNLIHLVRNAIDHGIEAPADRSGKDETARLELRFTETSEGLSVVVGDDGRGIDARRVVEKAIQRGLLDQTRAARLSQDEALALIFADGLSTAESVSDTSGRGVGMSAVKEVVDRLGGTIVIRSRPGKGTEFEIDLPIREASASDRRAA